jgi:adenine-specific DNA-methyltransferase
MPDHRKRLQELLRELFQFDSADLDFGIYRVMNQRRAEIDEFIERGLLDAVAQEFTLLQADATQERRGELEQVAHEVRANFGADSIGTDGNVVPQFAQLPLALRYVAKKTEVEQASVSVEAEADVFNNLYTFFSRYYADGDFISTRRYSQTQKYAIPYNGEEIYLHWANRDQYYIKTADVLTDYAFVIGPHNEYRIRLEIARADTEQGNVKGDNRFFVTVKRDLAAYDEASRTLTLHFEYRPLGDDEKEGYGKTNVQSKIIEASRDRLLKAVTDTTLRALLANQPRPDDERSLLELQLLKWTRKSTSDFFVHKDLRAFLNRELDFYIKNEVMRLDNLDDADAPRVESYLTRVKVIKRIARKVIDFLAQIEDFQKQLFEKPKFVLESNWCVTLDRVPQNLYTAIAANDKQWAEWERLFGVTKPKGGEKKVAVFLSEHPFLTIDTALYDAVFKDELLAALSAREGGLAAQTNGLLIHGENFQALTLLQAAYRGRVKCIYIDPPYNTGNDGFVYKDAFQHSTWLAMMEDRLQLARDVLSEAGLLLSSIDENEVNRMQLLAEGIFGNDNVIGQLVWKKKYTGGKHARHIVDLHEYILVVANDKNKVAGFLIERPEQEKEKFELVDEFVATRGKYYIRPLKSNLEYRPTLVYPITLPDGKTIETQWLIARSTFEQKLAESRILLKKKRNGEYRLHEVLRE